MLAVIRHSENAPCFSSSMISLAVFNVIAMGLTNASVGYMNYPTQLMFKSCKVISVMAMGILLRGTITITSDIRKPIVCNFRKTIPVYRFCCRNPDDDRLDLLHAGRCHSLANVPNQSMHSNSESQGSTTSPSRVSLWLSEQC